MLNVHTKDAFEKKAQHHIESFVKQFRGRERTYIPEQQLPLLLQVFHDSAGLRTSFDKKNPCSVMETVILALYILNASDEEIAGILGVTISTVKSYMSRIKEKLEVATKMDAVIKALRLGIIKIIY